MARKQDPWVKWAKENKFLIFVFVIACLLMLPNLGDRYFWGDEVNHVLLAKSITEHGYPSVKGYEGINEFWLDDLFYNDHYVYIYHPWLMHYIIAAPMLLFGEYNEAALRFPFALFGILSIIMTYFLAIEFGFNKRTAKIATILALTSTAIYLHSRQAIYYSLTLLLSMLMVYLYLQFIKNKEINKKTIMWFTIVCILFFYTQYFMFAAALSGMAIHFIYVLVNKARNDKKEVVKKIKAAMVSVAIIILFALPWILFTNISRKTNYIDLRSIVFNNVVGWFIVLVFMFPLIFIFGLPYVFGKKFSYKTYQNKFKKENNYEMILLIPLMFIFWIGLISLNTMTPPTLRYLFGLLPLSFILVAAMLDKIAEKSRAITTIFMILLIFTNLIAIIPFVAFGNIAKSSLGLRGYDDDAEQNFLDKTLQPKAYFTMYLYEITHDYDSAVKESIDYINSKKNPEKTKNQQIFTNIDQFAHGYYTGINATGNWSKFCAGTFDWIVLYEKTAKEHDYGKCFNQNNYIKVEIKNNADDWVETPDLISHRFATKRDGIISVYQLKD